VFARGQLADGCLQVAEHLDHAGVVLAMEGIELVEKGVPALDAPMAKHLPPGHHLEGDAAEAQANLDATVSRILPLAGPLGNQRLEVVMAHDQVVGNAEDGSAQRVMAKADQRAVGFIYLVTLVTRWPQSSAARDRLSVGVVLHGPRFTSEVGGADDVDTGDGQQQDVRRLDQATGDIAFQSLNLLGFLLSVIVQGVNDTEVLVGGGVTGRGLLGSVDHRLDGALLEAVLGRAK
jgi:hypothetical protein